MKPIWKWILGVVILLVVITVAGFAARDLFISPTARVERFDDFHPPRAENFDPEGDRLPSFGYDKFHGPRDGFSQRLPMHGNRGFGGPGYSGYGYLPLPFLFYGGFVRLLFPLGLVALVAYIAYQQGKKIGAAEALLSAPASKPEAAPKSKSRKAAKNK